MLKQVIEPQTPVLVEWRDSTSYRGWQNIEEGLEFPIVHVTTIGFVVATNDDALVLTMSMHNDQFFSPKALPWEAIESLKEIEFGR